MIGSFDKEKFKAITKKITQKEIAQKLTDVYGIETKIDTVKSWTRTEDRNNPTFERLNAIADMCKCSIQDFFTDAEEKREQIAYEELSKKPQKYSNSLFSSLPKDIQELLNYYQMLNADDRDRYLNEIKDAAMRKLHGN